MADVDEARRVVVRDLQPIVVPVGRWPDASPRDRGSKPGKPIPAGLVSRDVAAVIAIISGGAGLALGWMSGPTVLLLGILVMAIGYGYDLVFKGTAWSWLPFAVGIPLLPVYGWVGAAGTVPSNNAGADIDAFKTRWDGEESAARNLADALA